MTSNITYEGNVTITIKKQTPVKRKNKGTYVLFKLLTNTLARVIGSSDISLFNSYLPCYMSMIHSDQGKITSKLLAQEVNYGKYEDTASLLSDKLVITSRTVNSDNSVCFSSLLSHSQTLTTQDLSSEACYILLIDNNNNILAFVQFDFADVQPVFDDANGQAVIDWTMSFSNKE